MEITILGIVDSTAAPVVKNLEFVSLINVIFVDNDYNVNLATRLANHYFGGYYDFVFCFGV